MYVATKFVLVIFNATDPGERWPFDLTPFGALNLPDIQLALLSAAATATILWIAGAALAAIVFGLISLNAVRHRKKLRSVALGKSVKKGYRARREERARNRNRRHYKGGKGNARSKGAGQGQRGAAPAKGARP